ncbi:MAG: hypothetical protein ACE5LU_18700 [Anaerolineae bacterium]
MNLKMPDGGWYPQARRWKSLTARLFSSLQDALARGVALDFDGLHSDLETWEPFIFNNYKKVGRDKRLHQWQAVHSLLWGAERAASISSPNWDKMDRIFKALAGTPDLIKGQEGWALDCIRVLRNVHAPVRSLRMPIALSDELLQSKGSLATLIVETLQPGGGQVFHHPADALTTYLRDDFIDSMQDAWEAAKALAGKEDDAFDGRWRLLLKDQPIEEIRGRSAGGAAALGWYHALRGTVPDERVIVLAEVNRNGELTGVEGVPAKVRAIAADGRFDKIAVASDENRREAEDTLGREGKESLIRVKNLHDRNA